MTAPGAKVPKRGLVAVLSAAPAQRRPRAGPRGSAVRPAVAPRRRETGDSSRTYHPPRRLRVGRALVERCAGWSRVLALASSAPSSWPSSYGPAQRPAGRRGAGGRLGHAPGTGAVAAGLAIAAKWLLVGRVRRSIRCGARSSGASWPTPSSRSSPRRGSPRGATGTPVLTSGCGRWARGRPGVWCETYWLPEADLVAPERRRDGQPRLRRADPPLPRPVAQHGHRDPAPGATLGPNSVILPAASLGRDATVGPGVAGDERRGGARPHPVDRQPDRPVATRTTTPRPTGGRDDLVPGHGDSSYDVRLRPGPDVPPSANHLTAMPLDGSPWRPRPAGPRPVRGSVTKVRSTGTGSARRTRAAAVRSVRQQRQPAGGCTVTHPVHRAAPPGRTTTATWAGRSSHDGVIVASQPHGARPGSPATTGRRTRRPTGSR